jgi:uncharacterized protein
VKIAIVGAGISGLTCAHLLHPKHQITVFEAETRAGGHTRTVAVETDDAVHHVDTGFIVFNDRNYPGFERLLERIGVESQPSNCASTERRRHSSASTAPDRPCSTTSRRVVTRASSPSG